MAKETRGVKAGHKMADALTEFIHMMYQKNTARRVLQALISRLTEKVKEFE